MLQAPHLIEQHADELDDVPYIWPVDPRDGDRSLVGLPPHHIVIREGLVDDSSIEHSVRIGHSAQWQALASPDPTDQPSAPPIGEGRVGGLADGLCPASGWHLHRVLELGTFPGVDDGTVPAQIVACPNMPCMWTGQFFSHADGAPVSMPRVNEFPDAGMPVPDPVPDLPATFHPTPPRWHVQDWGLGGNLNRVGGVGSWVQDMIYPTCPTCAQTMPIVAQFGAFTPFEGSYGWERWTEGIIYAFWCRDCRISAVTDQQT